MKFDRISILEEYIEKQGIQGKKNISILVDRSGKIISLAGFSFDIGLVRPLAGSNIGDFHPVFEALFPIDSGPLVLPNVETKPGTYFDIHLLPSEKICWILFEEKTKVIEDIRRDLQQRNEENFSREKRHQDETILNGFIGRLDYLVFKEGLEGEWQAIGEAPAWSHFFIPDHYRLISSSQLCELFPFLETLFQDRNGSAQKKDEISGIWTEQQNGETFHFRAGFMGLSSERLFFIKKLHPQFEANQEMIQVARNQELDLEDWTKAARIAQSLNQTKSQFVSIISHDLRSPFIG